MEWIKENKKKTIFLGGTILILIAILAVLLIKNGIYKPSKTIAYNENKELQYKVILKQNDYYALNYMEKGNQYIANLINIIDANFKYDFKLENDYDYKYKIIGTVEITDDKTSRVIYTHSEDLLNEKEGTANGLTGLDEKISIDFNKYNDLAKKFISTYELKNVTAVLNVDLDFEVDGVSQKFAKENSSVMTLAIPLGTNTIPIDVKYDPTKTDNFLEIKDETQPSKASLICGILLLIVDTVILGVFVIYVKVTATDEDKYNSELKKIINNYESYISKVEDDFNMDKYQIIKVHNFSDLIEIRDTMQLPIIMMENKEQLVTCFFIPTTTDLLYFYSLNVKQYTLPSGKHTEDRNNEESNKENTWKEDIEEKITN